MQCSFCTSPGGNYEAVGFVYTVKSYVHQVHVHFDVDIGRGVHRMPVSPHFQLGQGLTGTYLTHANRGCRKLFPFTPMVVQSFI